MKLEVLRSKKYDNMGPMNMRQCGRRGTMTCVDQ